MLKLLICSTVLKLNKNTLHKPQNADIHRNVKLRENSFALGETTTHGGFVLRVLCNRGNY